MPRLQSFYECVARALCDAAGAGSPGAIPIGEALLPVVRSVHQQIAGRFTDADLRDALREAVTAPQETVDLELEDAVATVATRVPFITGEASVLSTITWSSRRSAARS